MKFKECVHSVYHSGDTFVFGDMALIYELLKPDILLIFSCSNFTVSPNVAANAVKTIFKHACIVIPIKIFIFPQLMPDNFSELQVN